MPSAVRHEASGESIGTNLTLSRLENGDTGVGLAAFLNVAGALGVRDALVTATDPYETDLGRARADQVLRSGSVDE